jgi:hypothetical protein
LHKRGKSDVDVLASLEYLRQLIEPADCELYGEFEAEARERLRWRDENDWPVLAGIAVWTTNRIEIFLKSQKNRTEAEQ